jgi:hypothetical protein
LSARTRSPARRRDRAAASPRELQEVKEGQSREKDVFDENVVTTYEISIDPADWDAMVADPESDTWRRMTMTWEGETLNDVAVHPSGQHSACPGIPSRRCISASRSSSRAATSTICRA